MSNLTKEQEQEVDALILADRVLDAMRFYKQAANISLREAMHEISSRQNYLIKKYPKVKPTVEVLVIESIHKLNSIQEKIVVLEGSWDGDDRGWVIIIAAITEQPSGSHERYTAHNLCEVRGARAYNQINEAGIVGSRLASYANAQFYLTDNTPDYSKIDDTKRWWDSLVP